MENLCAIFLDKKGEAKRMPWRKTPVPLELNDEEDSASVRCKMYVSLTLDRTRTGSAWSMLQIKRHQRNRVKDFKQIRF